MTDQTWRPFRLMHMPVGEVHRKHVSTCGACMPKWMASATAIHEATHAAVALKLGLKVEFVAIDEQREVEATSLEAALYPIVRAGMKIPATITRLDPRALQRNREEVLVAMAAPSCVETGFLPIDEYAAVEAFVVRQWTERWALDTAWVLDRAKRTVESVEPQILAIAAQLAEHGWVDAPTLDLPSQPS
jgi:hypothetical protein